MTRLSMPRQCCGGYDDDCFCDSDEGPRWPALPAAILRHPSLASLLPPGAERSAASQPEVVPEAAIGLAGPNFAGSTAIRPSFERTNRSPVERPGMSRTERSLRGSGLRSVPTIDGLVS